MQLDLFAPKSTGSCGDCANLGAAIESGVRYCHGLKMWRWASERFDCYARSEGIAPGAQIVENEAGGARFIRPRNRP